ncbi:MAG TPA: FTR1 family protein [Anaeromyxobacter sp.]|nr:FTR1 family protein [Anaeromyxobacter sp.]
MLATALIVFREILEAGLVVGIVLAATRGVRRRGAWAAGGVMAGAAGACAVAAFADRLSRLLGGVGQEVFNASVLGLAVAMLVWHNVWMASHGRAMAAEARKLGAAVLAGERPMAALSVVCGVAVLREGSEVVLFLYGIAVSGGASLPSMVAGGLLGLWAGGVLSTLVYLGLAVIPIRHLFAVTSVLITLLAAGLAAQAVAFLQQAGYLGAWASTLWDSSRLLPEDGVWGRLLHTLVGYTDRPSEAQLFAYLATVAVIAVLTRLVRAGGRGDGRGRGRRAVQAGERDESRVEPDLSSPLPAAHAED